MAPVSIPLPKGEYATIPIPELEIVQKVSIAYKEFATIIFFSLLKISRAIA